MVCAETGVTMPMTVASVTSPANNRLMTVLSSLNHNALDLIEAHLIAPTVIKLRRTS